MRLFPLKSGKKRVLFAQAGAALAFAVVVSGCGDNYRPVVTPIESNGPPSQPTSYVIVVSSTGAETAGVVTIVDYSGDSILNETPIGYGPLVFTLDQVSSTGYTVNSNGTLSNFAITTSLQAKNVSQSTLPPNAKPVNLMAPSSGLWATDLNGDVVDLFSGSPQAFQKAIPVATSTSSATMPVFVAGSGKLTGQREYVLSQNVPDTEPMTCNLSPGTAPLGVATPIEISSNTTDPGIPVGKCPVYAVQTPDLQRLFVLNRGDDTITVINSRNNTPDSCTPFQNQSGQWITCHPTIQLPVGSGPVFAEYNATTEQLIVANYDGGTISVVNVPVDGYGNDANTYANGNCTTYAACGAITGGFGTFITIPVGNTATPNPAAVAVLADGTKAYTANQNDDNGTGNGSVTVVNLSTYTVEKTVTVVGHPRMIAATQNSEYAKIYTASPDSPFITIIQTSPTVTDQIDTTVLLEGKPVDLRVTTTNGGSGSNDNFSSRVPGYGQPCNLSPSAMVAAYGANYTLGECQAIP